MQLSSHSKNSLEKTIYILLSLNKDGLFKFSLKCTILHTHFRLKHIQSIKGIGNDFSIFSAFRDHMSKVNDRNRLDITH